VFGIGLEIVRAETKGPFTFSDFHHLQARSNVNCLSLFCSLDRKKKNTHLPTHRPPFEEIRTEVVESGQKRQIKTPGVNGHEFLSSTWDPINQNTS